MAKQKAANDSLLQNILAVGELSSEVKNGMEAQFAQGKALEQETESLSRVSGEVAQAREEQRSALNDAAKRGEELRVMAQQLQGVAGKVEAAFARFKTEE